VRKEFERQDIVARIVKEANIPVKAVEYAVSRVFEIIAEELRNGNTTNITKFGRFEPNRVVKNNVKLLGKTTSLDYMEIVFRPHQSLKDYVNDRKKK
jgi:nucleoid DNA-binding protein